MAVKPLVASDARKALRLRCAVIATVLIAIGWWGRDLHWDVVWQNRRLLLNALGATAAYSIVCLALGLVFGTALAAARAYGHAVVRVRRRPY